MKKRKKPETQKQRGGWGQYKYNEGKISATQNEGGGRQICGIKLMN